MSRRIELAVEAVDPDPGGEGQRRVFAGDEQPHPVADPAELQGALAGPSAFRPAAAHHGAAPPSGRARPRSAGPGRPSARSRSRTGRPGGDRRSGLAAPPARRRDGVAGLVEPAVEVGPGHEPGRARPGRPAPPASSATAWPFVEVFAAGLPPCSSTLPRKTWTSAPAWLHLEAEGRPPVDDVPLRRADAEALRVRRHVGGQPAGAAEAPRSSRPGGTPPGPSRMTRAPLKNSTSPARPSSVSQPGARTSPPARPPTGPPSDASTARVSTATAVVVASAGAGPGVRAVGAGPGHQSRAEGDRAGDQQSRGDRGGPGRDPRRPAGPATPVAVRREAARPGRSARPRSRSMESTASWSSSSSPSSGCRRSRCRSRSASSAVSVPAT